MRRFGLLVLFLAAVFSVTLQFRFFPVPGFRLYCESTAVARSLAAGQGFANPFGSMETGPTAHLAPIFPLLLAALIRIFGDSPAFVLAASILCVLVHAFHTVMLVPLSKMLIGDSRPGIWAALFTVVVPTVRLLPQWEAIDAAAAAMLFCLASDRLLRSGQHSVLQGMKVGVLCGLLLLLHPALLTICVLWLGFVLSATRPPWRSRAILVLALVAAAGLVCLPWSLRNRQQLGAIVFVRDNLGIELYTSNADCALVKDSAYDSSYCRGLLHPNLNVDEARILREMGEVNYNRNRLAVALRWMGDHRSSFALLTLRRVKEFWLPNPAEASIYEYSLWIISGLSVVGLGFMFRERKRAAWFLTAALALFPAVYYLVQSSTRYRFPVLWLSLFPAGVAMQRAARYVANHRIVWAPRRQTVATTCRRV